MLALLLSLPPVPVAADVVAVQAGTIHVVEDDRVVENGTLLIEDGRIVAVGTDVEVPANARVVDYGPDAVIVPGLVAANSTIGAAQPSPRTADPSVKAVDNFDPYATHAMTLAGGVTSAYLVPASGRLIAGQGAVVKLHGDEAQQRVLSASTGLQGSISAEARRTPGYWEPPVPATVDVGLGVEEPQLPRTTMGAIVALNELLALARGELDTDAYGPTTGPELRELITARAPWRMGAEHEAEIRALLGFFSEKGLPLILDGAGAAADVADAIAASGYPVIVQPTFAPGRGGVDRGRSPESKWPRYDAAAALAEKGVPFAIATPSGTSARHLLYAARLASRGGLSPARALRAVTLDAATLLGVQSRVGSLATGKDADFVVLNGSPMDATTGVVATWVGGEAAWKAYETGAVVVAVEELHVGDGHVLRPGELLMQDGRILEVGTRVARPQGATVVHGTAAMPGVIDALGHLGLEGSRKTPRMNFELTRIIEPGDSADQRVAKHGVTTVALTARGASAEGLRITPYKPAGHDVDSMVVADPSGVRLVWTNRNRQVSGDAVMKTLQKAKDYKGKWEEYEQKIAEWTPPPPEKEEAEEADEDEEENGDDDKENGDDDKKKKKKKKKKKEDEPAKPVTGVWRGEVTDPAESTEVAFKLRLLDEDGDLEGSLRCSALSDDLIQLEGTRDELKVNLSGSGSRGAVSLDGESDNEGKLEGKATLAGTEIEFEVEQVSTEYVVVKRPERRKEEKPSEPKGKPRSPGIDPALEPLRQAMMGKATVVVQVSREDEILDCVAAFEGFGIRPVLFGADDAWRVAAQLRGRVGGVLLDHRVIATSAKTGTRTRNRYAELQAHGIPVAFHSAAEEGAIDVPLMATYAVSQGMSPAGALRALTADAADMLSIGHRVGRLRGGLDADVLLLDGSPLDPATSILRVWVAGREIR